MNYLMFYKKEKDGKMTVSEESFKTARIMVDTLRANP